jgi:tungstate transport system substrate-binding protein
VKSAAEAFKKIAETQSLFMSRGDNSGTHAKEKAIWKASGVTCAGQKWYQETGLGMGQTLGVAAEKKGYTLADRGTYLSLKNKLGLEILCEGDKSLLNVYHVMVVNPAKWPKVNAAGAKAFADFVVSKQAQTVIKEFGVERFGQPLFFPDADKKE